MNEWNPCADCGHDSEWYMVHHNVWGDAVQGDSAVRFLCLNDLARRLGRPLTGADFPSYDMNAIWIGRFSARDQLG